MSGGTSEPFTIYKQREQEASSGANEGVDPYAGYLGISVRKIEVFYTMEEAFLLKSMRREYNQWSPFVQG